MKEITNVAASVQARLQRQAAEMGRQYQEILHYYAIERFLHRLSHSEYKGRFVLKGGLSFFGWDVDLRRPTRDIDFQSFMDTTQEQLRKIIEEICSTPYEKDGMIFDTEKMRVDRIMEEKEKGGFRFRFLAFLGRSRVMMQIDVSIGNVITPPQEMVIEYPTLLNMPPFELYSYNMETAIAEKVEAMVLLGGFNGRLKDYFDIYHLANTCSFEGRVLVKAIQATFANRKTAFPKGIPPALTDDFAVGRQEEWLAFVNKNSYSRDEMRDFRKILTFLEKFLMPVIEAARENKDIRKGWKAGEGWE